MQLSNYHSHCTFCDGRSIPEDFVRFAITHGFRAYGFSSHSPLPFETFWNMSKDDMPEYLQEIKRLCIDGSFREYAHSVERHFEGDVRLLVKRFFDTTMKMIEAGGIDIVGHMDKIYMNGQKYEIFNFEEDWYRKPFEACLDLVQEKGLMVEVNTKNWTKKKELYPRVEYLSRMREMNIPVMVNSDCHYPDLVNDGRKEAFKLLKQAGFKSTRELVKGKWQDIAL